ncbi:MAG: amino acid adenylation domain-containing protein [Bacteroidota bacterium]|nr:amino acid adenylation domain-containing protein [Bacteroidota bacterium]
MPDQPNLYNLLETSAEKFPDGIALLFKEEKINYRELKKSADNLSNRLKAQNISAGDRVAIYSFKSIDYVIAQFAILKTGAAYLPLDANAPSDRNKFIINNCEAKALIIHKNFLVFFQTDFTIAAELENDLFLMISLKANHKNSAPELAYILYTSGSTGKPKGVMYTHSAALEFIHWSSDIFKPVNTDRFSSHAPFHFDLSIFDLFVCIKHSATLVLIDESTAKQPMLLAQLISEKKISIWYSTPTILNLLATYGKLHKYKFDALRLVLFAGEVFPVKQFINLREQWSGPEYYNLYGPTETNVCTWYKVLEEIDNLTSFPIGQCCDHYSYRISERSELLISGPGTMLGYWENNELNEKVFIPDAKNKKWYNTGDIIEIAPNGDLLFKGRIDRMVKRNGFRIELQEIEDALNNHPGIIETSVVAGTDSDQRCRITAFVVCNSSESESVIGMKEYCLKQLPSYMIPDDFSFMAALPKTASDKTDYQKLKQILDGF